ncbi:MAG: hypothetical protein EA369_04010 [Bradymonadales bacterium]|nr:MAG: hypothetical protein EA369_04010 [Bradymonadales bacterium]
MLFQNPEHLQKYLLDAVSTCRANILDTFEVELSESPNWRFVRLRLLKAFGDRGLEGRVKQVFNQEQLDGPSYDD